MRRTLAAWTLAVGLGSLGGRAHAQQPRAETAADSRSMGFQASGGECRETVPGGTMLAVAYGVTILLLGAYVARVAFRAHAFERSLTRLEDQIARRAQDSGHADGPAA